MTEMMINGEAFNVLVEGDENAPALMLAHPLGANLHVFDKVVPELLRHFRVIRYDARGHGSSVVSTGPYSIDELGSDALGIIDALGLEKVDWLGVSKGGVVGLWLMTNAPERIGRAVLANVTAHFGSPDMWNERIAMVRDKGMESLAPTILENWFTKGFREQHPEEVERIWEMLLAVPPEGYAGASAALRDMDLRESIRGIANPVLVIVGRHDPVTPPGLGALVASAIPGARLVTLETAHLSCVEDPEGFDAAAIGFLTGEAPAEAAQEKAPAKPRKPRAPRKPKAPAEVRAAEPHIEPTAAFVPEEQPEAAEPPPHARPPKPRAPRRAAPAPAPAAVEPAPAIAAPAPRPRQAPAKKAPARKAPARKAPAKKAPAKKVAARKVAARKAPAKRAAVKKSAARKPVGKKLASKKTAMRKARAAAPARKAVVKKTVAKKSAAKKSMARKAGAKKPAAKKAPARTSAAKKALVRKAVVKKTQAKKTATKKGAAKKTAARKPMPRHLPGRRPPARKR